MRIFLSDLSGSGLLGVLTSLGHDVVTTADTTPPAEAHIVSLTDGIETSVRQVAQIRAESGGRLPLLVMGSWQEPSEIKKLIEAGADDFLPLSSETTALDVRLRVLSARHEWRRGSEGKQLFVQATETLAGLAGRIAHEYNNLLSAVQGNAELALLKLSLDPSTRYSLEQIRNSSRRAADLTRQLQGLARKRNGDGVSPLNLGQLIRDSADLIRLAACRNCRMEYELEDASSMISGDAQRLRQLLVVLAMNAAQTFGEQGGEIRIRTYSTPGPDRLVCLEVEDSGPSPDPAVGESKFSPFATARLRRGQGLTAARAIAREHGGRIEVLPGDHGRFRIAFPALEQDISAAALNGHHESAHPGTVLLIEDDDDLRMATHRLLRDAGYVVFDSPTGEDALTVFSQVACALDAVILDLTLPGLDTRDAIKAMRKIRADLRMVVCSNQGDSTARKVMAGIDDVAYVDKPVQLSDFVAVLQRALTV